MSLGNPPDRPLVTVLLPCFNAKEFLRPALDSVLGQTYGKLDVLAIDDGSTDSTADILREYAARDSRVRLLPNEANRGIIFTLNRGIRAAKGSLIARMDADDVAVSRRIEAQVAYFHEYPDTEVLCTDYSYIGSSGKILAKPSPYHFNDQTLRFFMFFLNPICHSSVMGRRATFLEHQYSEQALHSEDFELWTRMVEKGVVVRNLPDSLLHFRCTGDSVSQRHEDVQIATFLETTRISIERYFRIRVGEGTHRILINRMLRGKVYGDDLRSALELLGRMKEEYIRQEVLSPRDIELVADFVDRHLLKILVHGYMRSAVGGSVHGYVIRRLIPLLARRPTLVIGDLLGRI